MADRPTERAITDRAETPARITRRGFGVVVGGCIVGGAVFASRWYNIAAQAGVEGTLSTPDAYAAAKGGTILLVDIRRPDEWERTGIGEGAVPLDMRRKDFTDALLTHTGGRTDTPVALICARGVRSRRMSERLTAAGFTTIIDVPEGMLGSGAGPGWLKRGLPIVAWAPD
ncbi:rhodanese-like domain-containing protein [uncultured Tateyamaria sp.]|uniref:rhodanese-like domain-containing protein n=1 Tax=uncultured Tateyamaria sp. TaxID=455651 RepID=UPI002612EC01|nr:rhodanese-like domain-containing protein [uncultured Tateyamaria sp.]